MGEDGTAFKIITDKPIGSSWCRWEDNIKMNLKNIGQATVG